MIGSLPREKIWERLCTESSPAPQRPHPDKLFHMLLLRLQTRGRGLDETINGAASDASGRREKKNDD